MAKLTILLAAFAILLLVVDASIYRTTITTTEIDEENSNMSRQQSRRCREQLRRQDLSHCERYIMQGRRGELAFRRISNQQQHFQQCCEQMREIDDDQCRCEGLRQIMREQQQEGEFQGQEMQEMMQRAQNLPNRCGMGPQRCEMRMV